jgi:hypothetical protein
MFLTMPLQIFVLIGADEATVRSFFSNECIRVLETEIQSVDRLLTSFDVALAGDPGANWGVARALFDSFDDMVSLFIKSVHRKLHEFRAVSALNINCCR